MTGLSAFAQILGYRLFSLTYSNICLMARPEDLVLYKVMPTRDIVKCSSINMTNARLISNRKHKLPSQHKFSALSCRRADRVDSGRRLHSRRPPCHLTPRTVREKHGEDTGRQWMQRSQRWWWKRDKRRDGEATRREDSRQALGKRCPVKLCVCACFLEQIFVFVFGLWNKI